MNEQKQRIAIADRLWEENFSDNGKDIAVEKKRRCPECDGEGEFVDYKDDGRYFACQTCGGTGAVELSEGNFER